MVCLKSLWLLASLASHISAATHSTLQRRDQLRSLIGHDVFLRLMPLGASITSGFGSSDGSGYRARLRRTIIDDGVPVDMVGGRRCHGTSAADNDCEAFPGERIDQVTVHAEAHVPEHRPNLVLVNVGTNDALQSFYVGSFDKRMRCLLDVIFSAMDPGAVVLSTLLVTEGNGADNAIRINAQIRAVAEEERTEKGRPLVLVELHDVPGLGLDSLVDGIHPNDDGYGVMTDVFWQGILEAASKGFFANTTTSRTEAVSSSATPIFKSNPPTAPVFAETPAPGGEDADGLRDGGIIEVQESKGHRVHNPIWGIMARIGHYR